MDEMLREILFDSLLVSVTGAALSIDRSAAFQIMVSRPIVTAPLIGLLLGDPAMGLLVGVVCELFFMADLQVGAHMPNHETMLGAVITAVGVSISGALEANGVGVGSQWERAALTLPLAMLITMPLAGVYLRADTFVRTLNERFFQAALDGLDAGDVGCVERENRKGLLGFFVVPMLSIFVTVFVLCLVVQVATPALVLPGILYYALVGTALIGIASTLVVAYTPASFIIFSVSAIVTALVIWGAG